MFKRIIYMTIGKAVVAVVASKGLKKIIDHKRDVADNE